MWIDTHAHLFDYSENELQDLNNKASSESVGLILSTAVNIVSSYKVLTHCASSPIIYGAAGISPFDCVDLMQGWENELEVLLCKEKIIGLGEIGLDISNPRYPSMEFQRPVFEKQLAIAKSINKPVIIHSRGIEKETALICKRENCTHALFHCFTGDYDSAKTILDCGYYISFSGIITFKNADIREIIPKLPQDRILLETDTPYLAPVPLRGKTNSPLYMKYIGEAVAGLLHLAPLDMQLQCKANFNSLFGDIVK